MSVFCFGSFHLGTLLDSKASKSLLFALSFTSTEVIICICVFSLDIFIAPRKEIIFGMIMLLWKKKITFENRYVNFRSSLLFVWHVLIFYFSYR